MTRPSWLGRAVRNRHRHAIEQASHRWRGGRRDDSARTRRKILISTQVWIINSKQQAWFDALPAESQKLLADADAAEQNMLLGQFPISNHLKDLPYTSTFEMSPDAQLVGYLSQHTTHAILQAKPEIDALMAK